MKSYTDLEQSRKLSEILPTESADMSYRPHREEGGISDYQATLCPHRFASWIGVPCWSLAALLGVIPEPDLIQNSEGTWLIHSWVNAYPWSVGGYSNPVDACVEMIIKLHEQNLL